MSMGRIEIEYDEYLGLKKRIDELETELVNNRKTMEDDGYRIGALTEALEDVQGTGLYDRVFKWNDTLNEIKGVLDVYGNGRKEKQVDG